MRGGESYDYTCRPGRTGARAAVRGRRRRSPIPALGHDGRQGCPEVPAGHLRAVVAAEVPAEISAGTGTRTDAAQQSADAHRVPQQGSGADGQQDVRMRHDSMSAACLTYDGRTLGLPPRAWREQFYQLPRAA